jgi:hypothetical protein
MAFTPSNKLRNSSEVIQRTSQTANRLFSDDQFRLAPKHKFLYHVAFSINQAALKSIDLVQRHRNEINMLVKSCDLPNFNMSVETINQYNRKKNVMTGHKYNNISMTFHDDNMGLINQLWQNYYSYYFADPTAAQDAGSYNRNATRSASFINSNYGLDNGATLPFFDKITIYQMARHEYVSYTLINPVIVAWNHNKLDYAQSGVHDNTASFAYEAVAYGSGTVDSGDPEGFALEHYDFTPSPLTGGQGDTSSPSFASSNVTNNAQQYVDNLTQTINGYQNTQQLNAGGNVGLLSNIGGTAAQGVSGLQGIAFPVAGAKTNTVIAKQIKF